MSYCFTIWYVDLDLTWSHDLRKRVLQSLVWILLSVSGRIVKFSNCTLDRVYLYQKALAMIVFVSLWCCWSFLKKSEHLLMVPLKLCQQGNYSLRRPPKLTIPQAVIGQRWATVNSNLYKQTCMYVCMTHIPTLTPSYG